MQLVLAPADLQQGRIGGLALQYPAAVELRHELGDAGVQACAGLAAHLEELLVAPDDAGIGQLENGDGQRKIDERAALGALRLVDARFHKVPQTLFPFAPLDHIHDQQQHQRRAGAQREGKLLVINGGRREKQQQNI